MLRIGRKISFAFAVIVFSVFLALLTSLAWAQERVRKSIDDLTADELETYIYALKKLREKSATNPNIPYSYAHMAGIHNIPVLFDQACEHWNYRFLAWHRALLLNYEDSLRASDPPRTANVTIPFWDWSIAPSGKRFPVAFENDPVGVKAKYGRDIAPSDLTFLFRPNRNKDASGPRYPWSEIARIALNPSYEAFAGPPNNHGQLERPPHDGMHGFIGGDLVNTSTAANDPIFWAYHTFIDLIWWWRQQQIDDTEACDACPLRGMPVKTALGTRLNTEEDKPPRLKHVADATTLGFTYNYPVNLEIASEMASANLELGARPFSSRYTTLAAKSLNKPDHVSSFTVAAPAQDQPEIKIVLQEVKAPEAYAYVAFVYLHPSSVPFAGADEQFRNKYLIGHYTHWINTHAGHDNAEKRDTLVTADRTNYPELSVEEGTPLTITVAIHVDGTIEDAEIPEGSTAELTKEPAKALPSLAEDSRIGSAKLQ